MAEIDNYKLAIVHDYDANDKNFEQAIDYVGSDFEKIHSEHLLDYANEHYGNVKVFQKLNCRHTPETIGFFMLKIFNDIIFFNTTKDIDKYGYTGLFLLPDNISSSQKELLYDFAFSIEKYKVSILHSLKLEDGILMSDNMYVGEKETPREMLDRYFELQENTLNNRGRR